MLLVCRGRFSFLVHNSSLSVDVGCLCVVALLILFGAVDIFFLAFSYIFNTSGFFSSSPFM